MKYGIDQGPKTENDVSLWTVAIGEINPFATGELKRAQEEAIAFISSLAGFVGVHPVFGRGTLLLFRSETETAAARKALKTQGCPVGDNITEVYVNKKYVPQIQ